MSAYTATHASTRYGRLGFSLVELAIAITIIGILAALALPAFKLIQARSRLSALENDLRHYEQVFDTYELKFSAYPPSELTAGQIPAGMEGRLSEAWKLPSPIGGVYRWVYTSEADPQTRSAYIEVVGTASDPILIEANRLQTLDDELDNGNLGTGRIRISGTNIRFYLKL